MGITERHMRHIVSGARTPSPAVARRLESATGVSGLTWLYGLPAEKEAALLKYLATGKVECSRCGKDITGRKFGWFFRSPICVGCEKELKGENRE